MTAYNEESTQLSDAAKPSKAQRALSTFSHDTIERSLKALARYERRQFRSEHPDGYFDNARRFYPSDAEDCGVTSSVRSPSRAFPFSYMNACRSLDHCCDLEKVSKGEVLKVRKAVQNWREVRFSDKDVVETLLEELVRFTERGQLSIRLPIASGTHSMARL